MPPTHPATTADGEDRAAPRHIGERGATVRDNTTRPIDACVTDLSRSGFRLRRGIDLSPGMSITIGLPGIGARTARVVRVHETIGCAFEVPLCEAELASALTTAPLVPTYLPVSRLSVAGDPPIEAAPAVLPAPVRAAILLVAVVVPWGAVVLLR